MTQYLVTGHTFGATDEVTNVKLNNAVNAAVLQNVDRVAMGSTSKIVTVGTARPTSSVAVGECFFDSVNDRLEVFTASGWRSVAAETSFYITNRSPGTLASGDVVIFDSANDRAVTTTTVAGSSKWAGVVIEGGITGSEVAIAKGGIRLVNITGTVNRGDFLFTSTTVKLASGGTTGDGHFGIALANGAGGQVLAALHQQAISAIPTGAIVIFAGAACPTGYTRFTALDGKYMKGDATAAQTGGVNTYGAGHISNRLRRDTDTAPGSDSAPVLGYVADDKQFVPTGNIQAGLMQIDDTDTDNLCGDHQHLLSGVTNEPAFYTVLFCQKN